MDNPEKMVNANHTRQKKKNNKKEKQKTNTMCFGHHYLQTNTNNVSKTRALLQTTGGKDETNIVLYVEITTRNPKRRHIIGEHKKLKR